MSASRISQSDLQRVFADYRSSFPDWRVEHEVVLARREGLIKQHITFEALQSGVYRPSCCVQVCVIPSPQLLFRFLDFPFRSVTLRLHSAKWREVVSAMERQFLPEIREALRVAKVIEHAESEVAVPHDANLQTCAGLAVLCAVEGRDDRALWWCDRADRVRLGIGRELAAWEHAYTIMIEGLKSATREGRGRDFVGSLAMNEP